MPATLDNVAGIFGGDADAVTLNAEQENAAMTLAAGAHAFAQLVLLHTPMSGDQQTAIRKIREAAQYAIDAVRLKGAV